MCHYHWLFPNRQFCQTLIILYIAVDSIYANAETDNERKNERKEEKQQQLLRVQHYGSRLTFLLSPNERMLLAAANIQDVCGPERERKIKTTSHTNDILKL